MLISFGWHKSGSFEVQEAEELGGKDLLPAPSTLSSMGTFQIAISCVPRVYRSLALPLLPRREKERDNGVLQLVGILDVSDVSAKFR